MQLILVNLLHPLFLLANTYTQNLSSQQTSSICIGSFFSGDSHNLLLPYATFRNAAYENVHLDFFQSFFKIKIKAHSQLSKKCVDKFCSPFFCAILSSRKNVSNMLCVIMKILTEKNPFISFISFIPFISFTSFFASIPILSELSPKTS